MGVSLLRFLTAVQLLLLTSLTSTSKHFLCTSSKVLRCLSGLAQITSGGRQENTVRVTSELGFGEAIRQLAPGQLILLEIEELNLNETLFIDVPDVSIVGSLNQRTAIRCPRNRAESALIIKYSTAFISPELIAL